MTGKKVIGLVLFVGGILGMCFGLIPCAVLAAIGLVLFLG